MHYDYVLFEQGNVLLTLKAHKSINLITIQLILVDDSTKYIHGNIRTKYKSYVYNLLYNIGTCSCYIKFKPSKLIRYLSGLYP